VSPTIPPAGCVAAAPCESAATESRPEENFSQLALRRPDAWHALFTRSGCDSILTVWSTSEQTKNPSLETQK
jgi:hypothetical protein